MRKKKDFSQQSREKLTDVCRQVDVDKSVPFCRWIHEGRQLGESLTEQGQRKRGGCMTAGADLRRVPPSPITLIISQNLADNPVYGGESGERADRTFYPFQRRHQPFTCLLVRYLISLPFRPCDPLPLNVDLP